MIMIDFESIKDLSCKKIIEKQDSLYVRQFKDIFIVQQHRDWNLENIIIVQRFYYDDKWYDGNWTTLNVVQLENVKCGSSSGQKLCDKFDKIRSIQKK